ncbi:alpha/beta fold hydrolase [Mesorhizobium sp. ES1-1]|uniref:alpha/beta fold hydrolase n=1 Tax=Mesorhizobium sp. ES1-1 TaxID=2876629 RepID=UPI001CCB2BD3|nr:alpha/beta fold hydrolase [Mesorhizobium sp. ES1-1]MBZ9674376.1 alpha/beta hydrolase [Mesorhizobium sp. ES1-1]
MIPIVFDRTVGWLHPAQGSRGVVIAGAHGFEDLCSRRFLTLMARGIAEAGLPVLQFDYPGCGDAADDQDAGDLIPAWIASIASAIDQLKARTGVADVLVIGFRLGTLLVPAAISGRADIAGVALLAPPSSGKAYVREMIGLSRMIDATLPTYADAVAEPFEGIEAAGFRISAETAAGLRGLEWRGLLADNRCPDLLLMSSQPHAKDLESPEGLKDNGGRMRIEPFADLTRLMSSPTANDIPLAALNTVVGWTAERGKTAHVLPRQAGDTRPTLEGDGYTEFPLVLGPEPEMCCVLCTPANVPAGGEVVLIVNAGAIPHIGWARGAVEMARTLARRGIASMRLDLPGLGQSGTPPENRLFLYDERGRDDVIRTVDWLQHHGFGQVCAVGLCAGAYQAFHAARHDPRIAHLAMVNPLCFAWNGSYALDMGLSKVRDNARSAARHEEVRQVVENTAIGPRTLKSRLSKLGRSTLRSGVELLKSVSSYSRRKSPVGGQPVERWMRHLTAGGTRVLVVSADDDLSLVEIARHFGPDGRRLSDMEGVTVARLPASDHTLTPRHARGQLIEHIARLLSPTAAQ